MSDFDKVHKRLDGFDRTISQMQVETKVWSQITESMASDVTMIKEALVGDVKGGEGLITRVARVERFKKVQMWGVGVIVAGILGAVGTAITGRFL